MTTTTPALNNNNNNNNNMPPPPRETNAIVSIGQFRPEKDHALQLEAMARLLKQHPEWKHHHCKMVLIGSCRSGPSSQDDTNGGDRARLEKLQRLAQVLNIAEHVEFVVNQPFEVVQEWLAKGSVGIHTVRVLLLLLLFVCCRSCF